MIYIEVCSWMSYSIMPILTTKGRRHSSCALMAKMLSRGRRTGPARLLAMKKKFSKAWHRTEHISDHQGGDASTINTRDGCLVKAELHAWRMEEEQDLFLTLMVLLHTERKTLMCGCSYRDLGDVEKNYKSYSIITLNLQLFLVSCQHWLVFVGVSLSVVTCQSFLKRITPDCISKSVKSKTHDFMHHMCRN